METNDDILISGLENVYQRGDTLLVYHKARLSLFNMDGKYSLAVFGEIGENIFILKATGNPKNDRTFCCNKQTKELNKYFLTYSENGLGFLKGGPLFRTL